MQGWVPWGFNDDVDPELRSWIGSLAQSTASFRCVIIHTPHLERVNCIIPRLVLWETEDAEVSAVGLGGRNPPASTPDIAIERTSATKFSLSSSSETSFVLWPAASTGIPVNLQVLASAFCQSLLKSLPAAGSTLLPVADCQGWVSHLEIHMLHFVSIHECKWAEHRIHQDGREGFGMITLTSILHVKKRFVQNEVRDSVHLAITTDRRATACQSQHISDSSS